MPQLPTQDHVKKSIASWLRDYIKRAGFTQKQLADDCGVTEPTISNILNGNILPGFKLLIGLEFGPGAPLNEVLRFPHDEVARLHTPAHKRSRTKGAAKRAAG